MTLQRPGSQSRLHSGLHRRVRRATLALALEQLEHRKLMSASIATSANAVWADGPTPADPGPIISGDAASYGPMTTRTIDRVTIPAASPAANPVAKSSTKARGSATSDVVPAGTTITLRGDGLPQLSSRPGQGLTIYLDFDGYGTDLPFSKNGPTTTFDAEEQVIIYDCWRDIVSYFAPLNVNVTTIEPPTGGTNPVFVWQRITNSRTGGAAQVGNINNSTSNGFNQGSNAYDRHSGIAHEIGHQLGLSHQAEHNAVGAETTDYSDGFDNRHRPIMGVDFAENIRNWFYGRNSDDVKNLQDDWSVMARSIYTPVGGDGYQPDDVASATTSATQVPASGMVAGIIERFDDVDTFKFTTSGGTYQIAATPTFEAATSPKIELLDSTGKLIAARDDADRRNTNNNGQEFSLNLAAGTYYVRVMSSGDYTEQGEYLLTAAPLPAGWTTQDVGANNIFRAGTAGFDSSKTTLTQLSGGKDIWSTYDEFRFTSTTLTGDGSITARVDALDALNVNSKAGVMIRANTNTDSASVYVGIKPSGQLDPIVRNSPGGVAFTPGNPGGVTGPWVRLTRAGDLFTFERSTDGVSWSVYGTSTVSMGASVLMGFASSSLTVRQAGYSKFSNIAYTGALGMAAPTYNNLDAPTNLVAAAATGASTAINLAWSAVADATGGYSIERSLDGVNFQFLSTTVAGVTTFSDAGLFGSMRYFYRVAAIITGTTPRSTPSAIASAVNKPKAPVDPDLSYTYPLITLDSSQLLLNWTDVQGDEGYRIERSASGGAFSVIVTTPRNFNAYNDSGLAANTVYSYRVTPLTSIGDGIAPSLTISGKTGPTVLTNFKVASRTPTSLTLSWTDAVGENSYRLERSLDGGNWTDLTTPGANVVTYTDSGLSPLTRYYYRLRAVNAAGAPGTAGVTFAATPSAATLPATWTSADIGAVRGAGAGAGAIGGTWTVIGAGADIWNRADEFQYVSRPLAGDGSIVARLASSEVTDYYTKTGVMFRASTAADSAYVFMHYSAGPGLQFEYRDASGAFSNNAFVLGSSARWLRITRVGNVFTGAYSSDGVTWTNAATRTIAMGATTTAGLAVTSHNADRLTLATFDNVATTGGISNAAPTITTIASATPAIITGTSTTLNVLATDDGGEANLVYGWSIVSKPAGVGDPTFSVNNTNAAKTATAAFGKAGQYVLRVTAKDGQGLTATSDVTVIVSLRVFGDMYQWNTARPRFDVQFTGNIDASLTSDDLVLKNLTTGATIPASDIVRSFNTTSNIASFTFTSGPNGTLPDGNYTATFLAGTVFEPSGVALASNITFSFFVLAADMNHDRVVNFDDLVVFSQNYNATGKAFAQGNFDYDPSGAVNFDDLALLAQRYNVTLQPPGALVTAQTLSPAKKSPTTRTPAFTID